MNRVLLLLTVLVLAMPAAAQAIVPGKNGRVVFDTDRHGNSDIYSIDAAGGNKLRLTNSTDFEDNPSWSPDGQKIAYIRAQQVWVMNADGSDQHQVTQFTQDLRDPGWSPDGQRLIFATQEKGEDIWTIAADGSDARQVTKTKGAEFEPSWSPKGNRIAYVRERSEDYRVVTANPDGTAKKVILPKFGDTQLGPNWSPDGRKIMFYNVDDRVFVVNANGKKRHAIGYGASPTFSPDGKLFAYSEQDEEGEEGTIYSRGLAKGSKSTKLSPFKSRFLCDNPDWQTLP